MDYPTLDTRRRRGTDMTFTANTPMWYLAIGLSQYAHAKDKQGTSVLMKRIDPSLAFEMFGP